jgi:hypothetical protein
MKGNCTRLQRFAGNGTWQTISDRVNITGPSRTRETVEEDLVLDCSGVSGSGTKKKSPGTIELGDISVETIWNPADSPGRQQEALAVCAGTVTGSGNATLTLTFTGVGSPLTISVAVLNGDTPTVWAAKARAAIASNSVANALFQVTGTAALITLTRRTDENGLAQANDGTLNLAIATGTATGISAAGSSTATASGVAGYVNKENHHLFEADFENETATFWRIVHKDTQASGIIVHATVKELGEPSYAPNTTVKRTFTLEPTGEFFLRANSIETANLPVDVPGPTNFWGKD